MNKKLHGQKIDTVFVLGVFSLFAASVLMVLMLGARVYNNVNEMSRAGYDERTCLSYIWSKVKNGDESERVYVGDFAGQDVLCLEEEYDGIIYQTMIYFHDGWARELFCEAGLDFYPEDGTPVMKTASLSFKQLEDGLIQVEAGVGRLLIFPRSHSALGYAEGGKPFE